MPTKQELIKLHRNSKPWFFHRDFGEYLKSLPDDVEEKPKKVGTRTLNQNRAIHLWLTIVADELNKRGFTVQQIVEKIRRAEIRPTMEVLKEVVWRPYQKAATHKESTTQLNKSEVDKIYEGLNLWLGEHFELYVPFPSKDNKEQWELRPALQKKAEVEYPKYTGPPTI